MQYHHHHHHRWQQFFTILTQSQLALSVSGEKDFPAVNHLPLQIIIIVIIIFLVVVIINIQVSTSVRAPFCHISTYLKDVWASI